MSLFASSFRLPSLSHPFASSRDPRYKFEARTSRGSGAFNSFSVSLSDMCPTSHSTSCISSSCTFRCLPLVSHPVLSSAVPVVSRSRQPSSESRSSADDTSCSFTQSIRSAPSASFSPRPHQPAEALWAVAWVKEDEDDGGTSLFVSDANSEGLRRTPREQGKSPPLRMLCFYPPSYSTSRALWDVETSSGLHVVSVQER